MDVVVLGQNLVMDVEVRNSAGTASIFGAKISDLLGTVGDDKIYQPPVSEFVLDLSEIKMCPAYGMIGKFARTGVTEVDLSGLGPLEYRNQFAYSFYGCLMLKKIVLGKLVDGSGSINIPREQVCEAMFANCYELEDAECYFSFLYGRSCCEGMFANCGKLTQSPVRTVEFIGGQYACRYMCQNTSFADAGVDKIEHISGVGACESMFAGAGVKVANFASLQMLDTSGCCALMFDGCVELEEVFYPELVQIKANAFGESGKYKFRGCSGLREIHFRADMQDVVEQLSGYDSKWGANNATIYFDLGV